MRSGCDQSTMTVPLRFVICPMPAVVRNASLNCGLHHPVYESRACRANIFSCVDPKVESEYVETRPINQSAFCGKLPTCASDEACKGVESSPSLVVSVVVT
jgi:hypothetical protein